MLSEIRRRHVRQLCAATMLAGLAGLLPQAAVAQVEAPQEAGAANSGIADIVVTANRRDERNQDVPIAITALSADRLQQQGIAKEQDLQASVPSLVVGPNGQGSRDSQSFTIRGQGATFQASPGVVVYLNEVPLPAAITLSQQGGPGNFVDLENLQVLSGPQGTLFGRNTTGGAVLLVPKKPTNEFGGWIQGRIGNYDRREIEGAVNIPVIEDKLLVRVVGAYHDRDGYTRDVVWNKDRDDEHWYSGRIGITFKPTETIDNYTMIYGAKSSNNGAGFIHRGFNIAGLRGYGLCDSAFTGPCSAYQQISDQANALGPRQTALGTDVFSKTKTWGITNTTDIELSDTLTLRNIVSFQKMKLDYAYDSDGTILQQHDVDGNRYPAPGQATLPDGTPLTYANAYDSGSPRDDLKQFTEELQFQGKTLDNMLTYTVGGFYYDQKPNGIQQGGVFLFCPAAYTGSSAACYSGRSTYGTSQESKALYAQATLDFGAFAPSLEGLRLTGGYRHTWDKITGFSAGYTPQAATGGTTAKCNSTGLLVPTATAIDDCRYEAELKSNASTWLIGLDYKVTRDILLFAKVNRGYKSGGFNQQAVFETTRTFDPETVTSYEAGFKSDFRVADVPFRLNTTGYILDFKNSQRAGADFNPGSGAGGAVVRNADARIKGVEVEASMQPFKGLEIGGNFSYTDAKYTNYSYETPTQMQACNGTVQPGGIVDLSCLPYQYVSPYIWSIHANATIPVGDDMGDLNFFVNYSHTSRQYTDQDSLVGTQPGAYLEAFGILNMSLDWKNIGRSGVDAGLFVTNATNKLYRISNANVYGGLLYDTTLYGEPRMYGLKLRYRFGGE
ncbi:iron complex outermembrane receptor protein [Sphingobium sp. OAS761]|uniref:TonB-dependent receptor n=1 Tax=Sphingobium sp. OAS761 TaxID=2817901 RepID=UPI00209E10CA|nr:TonB-dependent receptor [Sphingobium sp. OAS761]MCP1470382.1 iron complex outermembrane receptor protein [Sphingobium sp. OAS761]